VEKEQADSVVLQYKTPEDAEWGANILTQHDLDYADIMNQIEDIKYIIAYNTKVWEILDNIEEYINEYSYPKGIGERWARRDDLDD
jgi:hypothetical protein